MIEAIATEVRSAPRRRSAEGVRTAIVISPILFISVVVASADLKSSSCVLSQSDCALPLKCLLQENASRLIDA